jgi:D-proline reductase (dithiol) PrdB
MLLTRPVTVHRDTPFRVPRAPLSELTLALVTTAGLHVRGDRPFTADDPTFRIIPSGTGEDRLVQSHTSIGFDRTPQARDINVVLPIDRLRELVQRGELGRLGPNHYAVLGAQQDPERVAAVSAQPLADRLRADQVDVVLLTPT